MKNMLSCAAWGEAILIHMDWATKTKTTLIMNLSFETPCQPQPVEYFRWVTPFRSIKQIFLLCEKNGRLRIFFSRGKSCFIIFFNDKTKVFDKSLKYQIGSNSLKTKIPEKRIQELNSKISSPFWPMTFTVFWSISEDPSVANNVACVVAKVVRKAA